MVSTRATRKYPCHVQGKRIRPGGPHPDVTGKERVSCSLVRDLVFRVSCNGDKLPCPAAPAVAAAAAAAYFVIFVFT